LHGLTAGLPDGTRPATDLVRVAAPDRGQFDRPPPVGVFVELRDGSVLFATATGKPGPPVFARRADVLKDKERVAGLWSSELLRTVWPDKLAPPIIWDLEKKTWASVTEVAFAEESVAWALDGKRHSRSYFGITPLLLHPPAGEPVAGSWWVRTIQGEEINLGSAAVPAVSGTLSKELEARWGGIGLKIPAADLVSVHRVVKE
jgi:hypothetical protein